MFIWYKAHKTLAIHGKLAKKLNNSTDLDSLHCSVHVDIKVYCFELNIEKKKIVQSTFVLSRIFPITMFQTSSSFFLGEEEGANLFLLMTILPFVRRLFQTNSVLYYFYYSA